MVSILPLFAFFTAVLGSSSDDVVASHHRLWAVEQDLAGRHKSHRHGHNEHKGKHGGGNDGHQEESVCHKWDWRKKELKLLVEMPAAGTCHVCNI